MGVVYNYATKEYQTLDQVDIAMKEAQQSIAWAYKKLTTLAPILVSTPSSFGTMDSTKQKMEVRANATSAIQLLSHGKCATIYVRLKLWLSFFAMCQSWNNN